MNLTELVRSVINSHKEITDDYIGDIIIQGHYEKVVSLHHLFKNYTETVDIIESDINEGVLTIQLTHTSSLLSFIKDVKNTKGRNGVTYNILIESSPKTITMLVK